MNLPEDLKHYRAPESMRKSCFTAAALIAAAAIGVLSAVALAAIGEAAAEALGIQDAPRPFHAVLLETSTNPARLRECEPGAVMTISRTRDGIPWFHHRFCLHGKRGVR